MSDLEDSDKSSSTIVERLSKSQTKAKEHVKQLQRLQEKDPEFYQYLKEHDKELLEFNDEDDDALSDLEEDVESKSTKENLLIQVGKVITTTKFDSWCNAIKQKNSIGCIRSVLRAYRMACHHGDDVEDAVDRKFAILSSGVFNKIMVFVLNEMDGILRKLLNAPSAGGNKETVMDLMTTKAWMAHGGLMRLYLGNTLNILSQMTDEQMISFTLKRIKASAVFLVAFPSLLRKYIRVLLHTWGTGTGALPVVSFLFLRDLCVRLGSDCLDSCLKGVYKAYVMNCKLPKHINRSKLKYINFLGNCVSELCGLDPISAYQHAFVSIRQLAMLLNRAITERGPKKTYQKVYNWQFLYCLELWTKVICDHNSETDFGPLAYPLTQILLGMATLVPTARFFPLRLRCIRMLNRLARATGAFIPVSTILLDMLDMKELSRRPTGGVGKAVDMQEVKQLDKVTLKTRTFQEECLYSVVEELAEHLSHWSNSIAFFELSFIPLVRLQKFCKSTKSNRFRREIKELIRQLEANCEYTNSRRAGIRFSPSDPAALSFLQAEEDSKNSPLLQFVANLRLKGQQRDGSMVESRVVVGADSSVFGSKFSEINMEEQAGDEDEGETVFSSTWMPEKKAKDKQKTKPSEIREPDSALDEDVVEDLVLSSEDEEEEARYHGDGDDSRDVDQLRLGKNKRSRKRKKRKISNGNNTKVKEGANSRKKDLRPPSSFAPRSFLKQSNDKAVK
ncbi:hypothetical protein HPP92_014667 [Vanilla planifolia]|uniref:Nucleolar complex protein 2 homolog n=1 Tax=Vanilla planifolia TaxID=51239 RepID=A0A835UUB3_VANPL|nr:hypothetical protein HPP92_014667 [Vanilla planifolia]